jgi:uncharacterized membrane protein YdjX (TVP38/TMEM64 family)
MSLPDSRPQTAAILPPVNTRAVLVKSLVLLVLAVLGAILYATTPLKDWLGKAGPVGVWFREMGFFGLLLFTVAASVLILAGVPRLLLCPLAGALYGFWIGLAASLAATMASYYVGFIWIRGRQKHGLDRPSLPHQLAFLAGDPGFSGVVIGRLAPAPGMVVTLALALSNVSTLSYILGSAIGLIPEAVPAVLAGVMENDFHKWGRMAVIALFCIVAGWLVLHYLVQRHKARTTASSVRTR